MSKNGRPDFRVPTKVEVGMGGKLYHYADSEEDMESGEDMEAGYSDIMDEEERAQEIADREDEEERLFQKE